MAGSISTGIGGDSLVGKLLPGLVDTSAKKRCKDRGGVWDEATKTCKMPQSTAPPQSNPQIAQEDREKDISAGVKNITQNKDGTSTLTYADGTKKILSQKEESARNTELAARSGLNINAIPGADVQGLAIQTQQRNAQAEADRQARFQQIAQQGLLTPQELQAIQEANVDYGEVATSSLVGVLPGALGGAATAVGGSLIGAAAAGGLAGATAGSVVPVAGTIVLGVLGAVAGALIAARSNLKSQKQGNINAAKDVLTHARTNMGALYTVVRRDPSRADEALKLYYDWRAQVQIAQRKVQVETQGNLNSWMNDGTDTLSDFDLFLQPGGYADIQLLRIQSALQNPTPATDAELMQLYQDMQIDQ